MPLPPVFASSLTLPAPARSALRPLSLLVALGLATGSVRAAEEPAFLRPPQLVTAQPDANHLAASRHFQGIPSLAVARGGRMWAVWYGGSGKGEDLTNYITVATSGDHGATWHTDAMVVDPDGMGPVRAFDPELWLDPTGTLWLFWAQAIEHDGSVAGVWAMTTKSPDSPTPTWSSPRRLTNGVMMCKPTVLSSGEWVLPVSTWRKTDASARMVVSTDKGATWQVRGGAQVPVAWRDYDEHSIVERRDGSLWMLVRISDDPATDKKAMPKFSIGESISTDHGQTWSELKRSPVPHVRSRFFITRLKSGNLLLVKHRDDTGKRDKLSAYRSTDDGKSWSGGLMLEERDCSYPDGVQTANGEIVIIYDRARGSEGAIQFATFTEEDVAAGKGVSAAFKLRGEIGRMAPPKS